MDNSYRVHKLWNVKRREIEEEKKFTERQKSRRRGITVWQRLSKTCQKVKHWLHRNADNPEWHKATASTKPLWYRSVIWRQAAPRLLQNDCRGDKLNSGRALHDCSCTTAMLLVYRFKKKLGDWFINTTVMSFNYMLMTHVKESAWILEMSLNNIKRNHVNEPVRLEFHWNTMDARQPFHAPARWTKCCWTMENLDARDCVNGMTEKSLAYFP